MGLLARIRGDEDPKMSIHQFSAAMRQVHRGRNTVAQLKSAFEMDAQAQTDMDWLVSQYTAQAVGDRVEWLEALDDVLMLAEKANLPTYGSDAEVQARITEINT